MNVIRAKSAEKAWGVDLGSLARIWKGGCIIRAQVRPPAPHAASVPPCRRSAYCCFFRGV
jgi:hypothetical protein